MTREQAHEKAIEHARLEVIGEHGDRIYSRDLIEKYLAFMAASGFKLVSREPTHEQLSAAWADEDGFLAEPDPDTWCWHVMWDAA